MYGHALQTVEYSGRKLFAKEAIVQGKNVFLEKAGVAVLNLDSVGEAGDDLGEWH